MKKQNRIVVAGHASLDITPVFPPRSGGDPLDFMYPGKLTQVGEASVYAGGCVSNTGLALAFFGADVSLIAKLGDDVFGEILKEELTVENARLKLVLSPGESTSYTLVIAPPGVDRIFLHNPGANDHFHPDEMDFDAIAAAEHFHFGYPPLMRSMYEDDGATLAALFRRVKALGLSTSLDMAAVDPDSDAAKCDWPLLLRRVLPHVDFFVPSAEEICWMLDRPRFDAWTRRAGGADIASVLTLEDIRPLAVQLTEMGAHAMLIKCGAQGIYLHSADEAKLTSAHREFAPEWNGVSLYEKSFRPDRLCSATGAGDTSIAAFLQCMLDGCPPAECLQLAAATGASCVTAYDVRSGLLPFDALREKIAAGWAKNDE